jgi:hypothetical protein
MANVLTMQEQIINAALGRIGYKLRVGSISEGSEASLAALDIYGQTRDFILTVEDYDFARASVTATAVAGAVPAPWLFMYAYPDNAVRIRDIMTPTYLANLNNPLPTNFSRGTTVVDGVTVQVILTNDAADTLVFTEQVTNPSLWQEGFTESVIDALASRLAPALADMKAAQMLVPIEQATIAATANLVG